MSVAVELNSHRSPQSVLILMVLMQVERGEWCRPRFAIISYHIFSIVAGKFFSIVDPAVF